MFAVDVLAGAMLLWMSVVFGLSVLDACQTPPILQPDPGQKGCLFTEVACVDGERNPTGGCCPATYACSGAFPNVGCGTDEGYCCPTQSGYIAGKRRVKQRRAN
jgi:hypothetical protein